jgi:GMP synthase-like glutamine amidotransferase
MSKKENVKKILVVDYNSKSADRLKKYHEDYHEKKGIDVLVEKKTEKKILKLSPEELKDYHIIHKSGSRVRKLSDKASKYILDNVNDNQYIIGTCHGAQVIADYHNKNNEIEVKKLDTHQKGKQTIKYDDKYNNGQKVDIHKAHSWGIEITDQSKSKLEKIASSEQKFHKDHGGHKGEIYEVFKVKEKNHYGIQGHGEHKHGKEVLDYVLDDVYKKAA